MVSLLIANQNTLFNKGPEKALMDVKTTTGSENTAISETNRQKPRSRYIFFRIIFKKIQYISVLLSSPTKVYA